MKLPRIMIAATGSGSGKTFITCGILKALQQRGIALSSFKCGPDYIDPMFHEKVLGMPSRNLDSFFADQGLLTYIFSNRKSILQTEKQAALNTEQQAALRIQNHPMLQEELSIIEGVMGYYDGIGGNTTKASAYEVAAWLNIPVVLIVNCKGLSTSVVPIIKGFLEYKENSNIKGVILNQLSPMLFSRMKDMIEAQLPVKVIGYVKRLEEIKLESRHLGLITPVEVGDFQQKFELLGEELQKSIDFDLFIQIAKQAPPIQSPIREVLPQKQGMDVVSTPSVHSPAREGLQQFTGVSALKTSVKIGIAKDEAFCFHYADNMSLLEKLGAELIYFSPIRDRVLPNDIQGLILNGGYPEVYARELEENYSMRESIQKALESGMPTIAECGGFMYLQEKLIDAGGNIFQMTGVLKGISRQTDRLQKFGYTHLKAKNDTMLLMKDEEIPVHEFHYFAGDYEGQDYTASKASGLKQWECGFGKKALYAGFPHLYYYSFPKMIERFLKKAQEWKPYV